MMKLTSEELRNELNKQREREIYDAAIDEYLRVLYGDYMQVPPPEQRHIHAIFMMEELEGESE